MKLITRFFNPFLLSLLWLLLGAVMMTACSKSIEDITEDTSVGGDEVYLTTTIRTRAIGLPVNNSDDEAVKTVRLVICDAGSGEVIYNVRHNVTDFINQPGGATGVWHTPIKIQPGQRDFYFIANEESWAGLAAAFEGLRNRSDFYTNAAFTKLAYEPTYRPTAARPMLMTRVYRNVTVNPERNGKGSSETNPQHFIADGDEEVELIRTLAKVRLRVKGVVEVEKEGTKFVGKRFSFNHLKKFRKLTIAGVPPHFSLFLNPYFGSLEYLNDKYYTKDFYPGFAPVETEIEGATSLTRNEAAYTAASYDPATGVKTYYDYVTTLYVPEHLRPYLDEENKPDANVAGATTWQFYSDLGTPFYYVSVDHRDFTGQNTGSGQAYQLTTNDAAKYSRYSMLRNNFYDIEAYEKDYKLFLKYTVKPWYDVTTEHVYVGQDYNILVQDSTFTAASQNITILTSSEVAAERLFSVKLKAVNSTAKMIKDGQEVAEVIHNNKANQSKTTFTFNNAGALNVGDGVLGVYFNDELVYTIKKK